MAYDKYETRMFDASVQITYADPGELEEPVKLAVSEQPEFPLLPKLTISTEEESMESSIAEERSTKIMDSLLIDYL